MNVNLSLGTASARLDTMNNRIYVGRDPAVCGLAFADATLSRRHAEIWVEQGQTYVRDLGSSNGTWINGQALGPHPVAISPGAQVYVGHVPLGVTWEAPAGSAAGAHPGSTMMVQMPAQLLAQLQQRQAQMLQQAQQPMVPAPVAVPMAVAHTAAQALAPIAPAGTSLGLGGAAAPVPAEFAYRRQGANGNGVLLIALRADTFSNQGVIDGFVEFTATDDESVASITVELLEFHKRGPSAGHVWDRVLVRQGPWRARKGDVLPLPFQLRVPPGTSISGRDVHWAIHGLVDINWAVDVEASVPITMRNSDVERVRDSLGALDYRIVELEAEPLGQRFIGKFSPPANLRAQLGINDLDITVDYLGSNLRVTMHVDKKGIFKRDRTVEQVFDLAQLRAAPVAQLTENFRRQIDDVMTAR